MNILTKVTAGGLYALAFMAACNRRPAKPEATDTPTSGHVKFVADQSFQPILDQEHYIFKALYPETNAELFYRSENEAVNMLLKDSVRTAILARELNVEEVKAMTSRTLPPETMRFAIDAVAIIVNRQSTDTLITVKQIKQLLNGTGMTDKNVVFDNPNSSLVRYLKQLSGNMQLKQKNVYALNTNKDVIQYVNTHTNAIGIVGFNWLNEPDADYAAAAAEVKIVGVKDDTNDKAATQYFKPSQVTLALKQYPLSRELYIVNCSGRSGLATAFADFLKSDRGQRIILKSGLLPDSIPSREINIVK